MPAPTNYNDLDAAPNSEWLEKTEKSNSRTKWIVIGVVAFVVVAIGVGVGVGVSVSKKKSSSDAVNNATSFPKNSALKQSFWGIAYAPLGSQLPDCGATIDSVIEDIQLLSQLTTNIRLYGSDCNQSSFTLEAINKTGVNMNVWLGNYPAVGDNGTAYYRQKQEIIDAINMWGVDNVAGITVGNEFVLDYMTAQSASDQSPNGSIGTEAAEILIPLINDTRTTMDNMGLSKKIPIGNADAGSYFNNQVLESVDYAMANAHPWFANQSVQDAAGWTWNFFETTDVAQAQGVSNDPTFYIGETGWPTGSSTTLNANPNDGPSIASVDNLQIFIDNFACQATKNSTYYFFFEYMDQPWQGAEYGGVEGYWGLFDSNKNFKNLTLPTC